MTVPHQSAPDHAANVPEAVTDIRRLPPQDLDAEQCVLGGMMLSKDVIGDVIEVIKVSDFYLPAHETIYRAIIDLWGADEPVDPITLAAELTKRGDLARVGGSAYLHTLVNAVPTAANAEYYAEIVHERAVLRRLIEAGTRIVQMGYAAEGDLSDIVSAAESEMLKAVDARAEANSYSFIGDETATFIENLEALQRGEKPDSGILTGITDLDSLTGGLQPGQLVIVAARPAIGKSTLALDFARSCSITQGKPAAFFSLEMGKQEIVQRCFSAEARVGLHHLRSGTVTEDDWTRLARRMPEVNEAPLIVDDSPNLTLAEIRSRARRIAQQHDLALVVVDYMQLVQPGTGKRYGNRQEEVSEISRQFKLLAKELGLPIVALSQLNRGPEQRTDKKPMMSDLRESGAIEQDADVVILLHREDFYEKDSPRAGEADLIVAKHRNGPTATITVAFQGHYSQFVDMAGNV